MQQNRLKLFIRDAGVHFVLLAVAGFVSSVVVDIVDSVAVIVVFAVAIDTLMPLRFGSVCTSLRRITLIDLSLLLICQTVWELSI